MTEQDPTPEPKSSARAAWTVVLAISFIIVAYFVTLVFFRDGPLPQGKFTLPDQMVAILNSATRVETFRVAPEEANSDPNNEILGYPTIAKGKEQGQEFAKTLAKTMVGGGVTQNRKKCGLRPGVAFRVWNGNDAVAVVVCFECNVLWPHIVGEPSPHPTHEWQDFDPVRLELIKLSTEAFPDDPAIQSLSSW